MAAPSTSTWVLLALTPFVAWRIYSRFRRSVGRQRLSVFFQRVTLAVFSLVTLLLAYASRDHLASLGGLAAGVVAGALLGLYGLHLTRFELTPEGLFYTPNAPLGIALSVLFLGRLAQRMLQFYSLQKKAGPGNASLARSPFTLVVFGLLAGYYIAYAIGLLRKRGGAPPGEPEPAATEG